VTDLSYEDNFYEPLSSYERSVKKLSSYERSVTGLIAIG
jgi:hypothetical protein